MTKKEFSRFFSASMQKTDKKEYSLIGRFFNGVMKYEPSSEKWFHNCKVVVGMWNCEGFYIGRYLNGEGFSQKEMFENAMKAAISIQNEVMTRILECVEHEDFTILSKDERNWFTKYCNDYELELPKGF